MLAPVSDQQQIEGLRFVAEHMTLEDFTSSINVMRKFCMTEDTAELLISRFKLIKQGIL